MREQASERAREGEREEGTDTDTDTDREKERERGGEMLDVRPSLERRRALICLEISGN